MTETTHTHEAIDRSFLPAAHYGACAAVFIEVQHANGLCTLRTSGRFATGADLDYLGAKLDQIRRSGATRVLADFTEVVSMGSTGLSFVIALYRILARESSGRFVLAGANLLVRQALDISNLSKIIPLAKDVESGLAALSS
jgi:anti-anti-sigma factor